LGAAPVVQMFAREQTVARTPRPIAVPAEAEAAHEAFLAKIKDPIWKREA
jgi:hypothetical protein